MCLFKKVLYHNGKSEKALKEVLVDRYPRDKFTITTKLPSFMVNKKQKCRKYLMNNLLV